MDDNMTAYVNEEILKDKGLIDWCGAPHSKTFVIV